MARTPNPYPSLDDAQYDAVVNGQYVKSSFSNASAPAVTAFRSPWPAT